MTWQFLQYGRRRAASPFNGIGGNTFGLKNDRKKQKQKRKQKQKVFFKSKPISRAVISRRTNPSYNFILLVQTTKSFIQKCQTSISSWAFLLSLVFSAWLSEGSKSTETPRNTNEKVEKVSQLKNTNKTNRFIIIQLNALALYKNTVFWALHQTCF